MFELMLIYKWTVLAGLLSGAVLSLIGAQLASRNQAVQTLVASQGASLGIVLALAGMTWVGHADLQSHNAGIVPLVVAFLSAGLFHFGCEVLVSARWPSRNTYYLGVVVMLMAIAHSVASLVPSLETQMVSSYFGDLALASDSEAILLIAWSSILLCLSPLAWKQMTRVSFDLTTFGSSEFSQADARANRIFVGIALLTIAASIQLLGLLFTLGCLFLPVMVIARLLRSAKGIGIVIAISSAVGVSGGFLLSWWQPQLPTVPLIVIFVVVSSFVLGRAVQFVQIWSRGHGAVSP